MEKLKYKTFTWPANPEKYHEELVREAQFIKNEDGSSSFTGIGPVQRVITGSGVFYGTGAYDSFRRLMALFADRAAGNLLHPVWGTRNVYFTKLQLDQSPRKDYVSYSFEFREYDTPVQDTQ